MRVRYISIQNRFSAAFCELRFVSFKSPSISMQSNNYPFFQFNDHHQSEKRVGILANCGISIPLFLFQSRTSKKKIISVWLLESYLSYHLIHCGFQFFASLLVLSQYWKMIKNYDISLFVHQQQQLFLSQQLEARQLQGKHY